jgi:hypothetical protein
MVDGKAADPEEARDLYAALLSVRERLSGPEHLDMLTHQASLDYWNAQVNR